MMERSLISSAPRETMEEEVDTTDDNDTICGIGNFRPNWLRSWASHRVYIVLFSLIGIVCGLYYAYRDSVMSTLEQRFSFKTKTSVALTATDKITPLLFGPLVGYFGGRSHRPRVLGLGAFVSALGCFVSALPYFIYGPADQSGDRNSTISDNGSDLLLCDGSEHHEDCDAGVLPSTVTTVVLLILGAILVGFGNVTYYSIGMAYLDDNAMKEHSPLTFAIAYVLRLFGPLLGYLMSSICLKYYENPYIDPGYGPDDSRWVGSWWTGFVLQGLLLLLFIVPICMIPKSLPGFKKPADRSKTRRGMNVSGMVDAVKRLIFNPLFVALMLKDITNIYGTSGYTVNLPKYMESQFQLTPSEAKFYSEVPGVLAAMIAVTIGGCLIWIFRPSMKFLLGAMIVSQAISASGYLVLKIPRCEKQEMANFGMGEHGLILEDSCNINCNCTTESFVPVCGSDNNTLYISPCHAGCEQQINKTLFTHCSCIPESGDLENYATKGFCISEGCWLQALAYITISAVLQFAVSILMVMQKLMLLRSVQPQDRSFALGVYEGLTSVVGFVPYLIIFGSMQDSACLVWESSCDLIGKCLFYDTDKFNEIMHGMSAGFSTVSVGTMCVVFGQRGKFTDMYKEDEVYEEMEGDTIAEAETALDSGSLSPNLKVKRFINCRICFKYD
ncbi:hypothetical protein JTE90_020180 [Oedothorax gibbosus]|uniref:Solute carrier organic anion transporter family member n=1 Tax=Oedothorax gibbosus TaxID=931172 RepID=A0AAV6U100_9ARAC|nr:hypothetical protein JTE90_020180 [Oedothorax gibbosus]